MSAFPVLLQRMREKAGFATGYAFYRDLGGRKFFGCTYRQYSNVEKGRSFPGARLLERIVTGLHAWTEPDAAREFFQAYLRKTLGSEELVKIMVQVLTKSGPAAKPHLGRAINSSFQERSHRLTRAQSEFIFSNPQNYWAWAVLTNDKGRWGAEDVAGLMGYPKGKIQRSLQRMVSVGMARKDTVGKYFCPLAGKVFVHPRSSIERPTHVHWLRRDMERMAQKQGPPLLLQKIVTRAAESELRTYFPQMTECLRGVDLFTTTDKASDTAFFMVETSVRKLLPF